MKLYGCDICGNIMEDESEITCITFGCLVGVMIHYNHVCYRCVESIKYHIKQLRESNE